MHPSVRALVRERAGNRCEYCWIHQDAEPLFRFHIEHVVPRQHGGDDSADNLALACGHCNRHKGTNLSGVDPVTGDIVPLYHPRNSRWSDHFHLDEFEIVGRTPTGRATVRLLQMNMGRRIQLRGLT